MKKTKKLTLSAMMVSLSVAVLYLASLFTTIDLSVSLIASFILLITLFELGLKYALWVYSAASLLSLLLLPQKYVAVMYLLFCGIYPIIRVYFDRLPRLLRWPAKLLYFTSMLIAVLLVAKYVFLTEIYSGLLLALFIATCLAAFVLSDILIGKISRVYFLYLRKRLGIDRIFR